MRSTVLFCALTLVGCSVGDGSGPDRGDASLTERDFMPSIADAARPVDQSVPADMDTAPDGASGTEVTDAASVIDMAIPDMMVGPPPPECDDGIDNDGNGQIDLSDTGCTSENDPRERGAGESECANGVDDDEDGFIDFPEDPGCAGAGDLDETDRVVDIALCANQLDDDGDGRVDYPNDPGCQGRGDNNEADPSVLPACANGEDDDDDGLTDFPADVGCDSAADRSESGQCGDEVPIIDLNRHLEMEPQYDGTTRDQPANLLGSCGGNAGGEQVFGYRVPQGVERLVVSTRHQETTSPTVLYIRRRCDQPADLGCNRGNDVNPGTELTLEDPAPGLIHIVVDTGALDGGGPFRLTVDAVLEPACRNGLDDDGDGLTDQADPGCVEAEDQDEIDPEVPPQCANGLDDDMDGQTDYPDDPDCTYAGIDQEIPTCAGDAPVLRVGQAGGVFEMPNTQGPGGAVGSCGPAAGAEVVLEIQLDDPSDVTVTATQSGMPWRLAMYARTDCREADSEFACLAVDSSPFFALQTVPRGRFFVLIETGFLVAGIERSISVTIESVITECNDEVDNDDDGLLDLNDPGCDGGRDQSEADPVDVPECNDGVDNDEDGLIDYPEDTSCLAAGDPHEGGCAGDPLWQPVSCVTPDWVWTSDRAFATVEAANQNRTLWSGCNHTANRDGLCSLTGTGWVSTDTFPMQGCNNTWRHIGGRFSGNCGGHDGDTVRRLVLNEDDCWDYRAEP